MINDQKIFCTGFGKQTFYIGCNSEEAYDLAAFLFADFPAPRLQAPSKRYDILSTDKQSMLSLREGEKQLYFGNSKYQLAYVLMNEVIYHCINVNKQQHAIHAGAVFKDEQCIVLPGASGKGKSTLTAWLIANGYHYLTDELIFLSHKGRVSPLTRPVNLKVNQSHLSWLLPDNSEEQIISDEMGSMIPHRLLNAQFSTGDPQMTHVLFPEYREGTGLILEELSPAKSVLYLMQSHVNARNLSGHGVTELSNIVRQCCSYKLIYGNFEQLEDVFLSASAPFPQ